MDVSGLVQDNNSEGGRISSLFFQKLFFFFQDECRYSLVFQSDYATSQPQGHCDQSGCNSRSKTRREVCVGEASQQSAKKRKQYSNFADTDRAEIGRYTVITVTASVLVRIEGGAKIGTAHSQR